MSWLASTPEAQDDIGNAYENILGRPVDPVGLANSQASLASGAVSMSGIESQLISSSEAQVRNGNIVLVALGRTANAADIAAITNTELSGGTYQNAYAAIYSSSDFKNDLNNIILINQENLVLSNEPNFGLCQSGVSSSSGPGALIIPSDTTSHLTATPLVDSSGKTILDANGSVTLTPTAFSPAFFYDRGLHDKPLYVPFIAQWNAATANGIDFDPAVTIGQTLGGSLAKLASEAALKLLSYPIANFGQQGIWDVQRFSSPIAIDQFRSAATIYIGVYAAAAGIPESMIQ